MTDRKSIHWDGSITAGNVLTAISMFVVLVVWGVRIEGRVDRTEERQVRYEAAYAAQRTEDRAYESTVFTELRGGLRRIEDILMRQLTEQGPPRRTNNP